MSSTRRAKGEGHMSKDPDGSWRGFATVNGKRLYRRAKTKTLLVKKLKEARSEQRKPRQRMPTLLEFAHDQLEGPLKHDLRYATWTLYETFWRLKLGPHHLSSLKLDQIRRADVQGFIDDHRSTYKPSSLRRLGSFVCMLLERATELELISLNPARKVRYPEIHETQKRVLDPEEATQLPTIALSPRLAAMLIVATHTGLRRGELCGIRWEDVDEEEMLLHVRRQITRTEGGIVESKPKTRTSIRDIELTLAALEAIKSQPRRSVYVFTTETGNPVRPDTLARDFRKVRSGTSFANLRLHDLRASYISILLELGADVRTVQELAGHASSAMTLEVYARSRRELKRGATDRLSNRLSAPQKADSEEVDS